MYFLLGTLFLKLYSVLPHIGGHELILEFVYNSFLQNNLNQSFPASYGHVDRSNRTGK